MNFVDVQDQLLLSAEAVLRAYLTCIVGDSLCAFPPPTDTEHDKWRQCYKEVWCLFVVSASCAAESQLYHLLTTDSPALSALPSATAVRTQTVATL